MFKKTCLALLFAVSLNAHADLYTQPDTLLDENGAQLLEDWLGLGELEWTRRWYGEIGASSLDWHSAVDGLTHTVSVYRAINALEQEVLVGGYTANSWGGNVGWQTDPTAFIFNLTQPEFQADRGTSNSTYSYSNYFPLFGGGHDLNGGQTTIGNGGGQYADGYVAQGGYGHQQGTIDVGGGDNTSYNYNSNFRVMSLETYTFSITGTGVDAGNSTSVPIVLVGLLPLLGIYLTKRRKQAC
jgi:hypothetical protein